MNRFLKIASNAWVLSVILVTSFACGETFGIPHETSARIEALREQIAYHNKLYFQDANPEISDEAYDRLVIELKELQTEWPDFPEDENSDSAALGDDRVPGIKNSSHTVPMLSLEKCYTPEELDSWLQGILETTDANKVLFRIEPKVDGMAVSLVYEGGRFVRAVTRGNGIEGDDITNQVMAVGGFPLGLELESVLPGEAFPERMELRGEIYMPFSTFLEINKERANAGLERYKSPRNLAAGSIRLKDLEEIRKRGLQLVLFAWGDWLPSADVPDSHGDFISRLKEWGFLSVEPLDVLEITTAHFSVELLNNYRTDLSRLDFPTDGLVFKVESTALCTLLGCGKSSPNWATAYKFEQETGITRIRSIGFQIGRTGLLTPVAELDPLILRGRTISRVSLHNISVMKDLDIRLDDTVKVGLRGDAIPSIIEILDDYRSPDSTSYDFPENCPECGFSLDDGDRLRCRNARCPERRIRNLMHFADSVGMKGITQSTITSLSTAGILDNCADFYCLEESTESVLRRIGSESFDELLSEIRTSTKAPAWKIVMGLGIPGIGPVTCKTLMESLGSLEALMGLRKDREELVERGLNSSQAQALIRFLEHSEQTGLLVRLLDRMDRMQRSRINSTILEDGPLGTSR